jgi:MFS family permease
MRLRTRFGALTERQFRRFFIGQALSLLGDGMIPLALAFAVLELTGSVTDLGLVLAARTLPLVGFLLFGGVFADRLPRRAVMVGADVMRFFSQGLLGVLVISGQAELWHFLVLQALTGSAQAFFNPALTGLTPAVVSAERLQQANALRGMAMAGGQIAGPAVAGVLVATVGAGWALVADAASFGLSAVFLSLLRLRPQERLRAEPFLRDLVEGWDEFRSRTWLWTIVLEASLVNMLSAPFFVLGAALARDSLGGPGAWALILIAFDTGALAGGLVGLRLRPRRPLVTAFAGLILFGVPSALLALELAAISIAGGALLAGAGLTLANVLWETTVQQHIPASVLSRVSAYDWFGSLAFQPIGFALVGPVSGALGVDTTLWIAAGVIAASSLVTLSLPPVRRVESGPAFAAARGSPVGAQSSTRKEDGG